MQRSGLSLINAEGDRAWMVIGFLLGFTNATDQLSNHLSQAIWEAGVGPRITQGGSPEKVNPGSVSTKRRFA